MKNASAFCFLSIIDINIHLSCFVSLQIKGNEVIADFFKSIVYVFSIIKNNFADIDLDPRFRVANENELILLQQEVLDEIFENRYAQGDARDDALARQIKKRLPSRENLWPFSEVTRIVSTEELLENLSWFEHQYQFCISILQQNADNKALHKKKVASIIDEL